MSHRRTLIAGLVLTLGVTACGTAPEVVLQAEPVVVPDATPASEQVVSEPLPEPVGAEPAEAVEPEPELTPESAPSAPSEPTTPPPPSPPATSDPELIVGDDGCVTDVALGLVITCYDPAAGPD